MTSGRPWTTADVDGYRDWIDGWIGERAARGEAADCADLALLAVVTWASQRGLHVPLSFLQRRGGRWRWTTVSQDTFGGDYLKYARWVRRMLGAQNLVDHVNSRPVATRDLRAGDFLVFDWRQSGAEPNIPYWHTIVYISPSRLWMGNEDSMDQPVAPQAITDDHPRGTRTPRDYLEHPDLYADPRVGPAGRRWKFFPRDGT